MFLITDGTRPIDTDRSLPHPVRDQTATETNMRIDFRAARVVPGCGGELPEPGTDQDARRTLR
ncbi:hypothetical protein E0H26_14410 [Micromonospora zingiberis]|uniref:Uncharacterized protein n=1 Tax=Micromonospora zingiberis TaxID=2053011 RepID=A0A4R0GKA9_9ACTN|nr:hypothetical protein [Micromonospora zingiberis]TCB96803.1 hypothetical protein E0H26_14410 [Micromonospora zingiberis]